MPHFYSVQQVREIAKISRGEEYQLEVLGIVPTGLRVWSARDVIAAHVGVQLLSANLQGTIALSRVRLLARKAAELLADIDEAFLACRAFTLLLSGTRVNILVEGEINRETPGYIKVSTRPAVEGMRAAIVQELGAVV